MTKMRTTLIVRENIANEAEETNSIESSKAKET